MDSPLPPAPFLSGNFAPVQTEDDFVLQLHGSLPAGLNGVLYRNGPNPHFPPRDGQYHWFFGDGMIHAFTLAEGRVTYRNRWVRTPKWTVENQAAQSLFGLFGNPMTTDPSVLGSDAGVANTNIIQHAGHLLALEEAHPPFELEPRTLNPLGYYNLGGRVTAHPKTDPHTGELIFFAYADDDMPLSAKISWGVASPTGQLLRRETFDVPYCSMIHDFMVTENYLLIPVLPLTGSLQRAIEGGPVFAWEPNQPARIAVMRRDQGVASLRWFDTDPCYVFHVMNAYESNGALLADVMRYPTAPLFPRTDGTPGEDHPARLTQWQFDLASPTNTIRETPLGDLTGEFPRFDERRAGLPYRHGWVAGQSAAAPGVLTNRLSHIDLATNRHTDFCLPPGDGISEAVFVPRAADAPEGDGWLLAVAYRAATNSSDLLVLNALDIAAGPIATASLPRRVPFGYHGNWVAA